MTSGGAPLVLQPGSTYTLKLRAYFQGDCTTAGQNSSYLYYSDLSYLKLGASD